MPSRPTYKYHVGHSTLPPLITHRTTTMMTESSGSDNHIFLCPRVPPELYRPIVECIQDLATLYSLSLASQVLRYEAERRLYSRMPKPRPKSTNASTGVYAHISFLTTITQHNPRLASFVHEYHSSELVKFKHNPLWNLTRTALRCMVNLKVLNLRTFGGHPAAAEFLVGCPFRLEKLHWGSHSDEEAMARVLVEQTELKELYMIGRAEYTVFPWTACPKLEALGGNRAVVEGLLPGRRISKVSWVPELEDSIANQVSGMQDEIGRIRTLSFGGYFARPGFGHLVHQLRSLEVLELIGLHSMELDLIKHLPSLRELVISLRWGSAQFPIPCSTTFLVVQDLFRDCPTLIHVDVVYDWLTVDLIRYQRWTRLALEPILVSMAEVRRGHFVQ